MKIGENVLFWTGMYSGSGVIFDNVIMVDAQDRCDQAALMLELMGFHGLDLRSVLGRDSRQRNVEYDPERLDLPTRPEITRTKYGKEGQLVEEKEKYVGTEVDPKNANAWYNKGVALSYLSQYNEAIQAIDKAIELDPKSEKARQMKQKIEDRIKTTKIATQKTG